MASRNRCRNYLTQYSNPLEAVPLTGCGLSLGCMGLQSVVNELASFYSLPVLYYVISWPFLALGLLWFTFYIIRGLCIPGHVWSELHNSKSVGAYATLFMSLAISLHTGLKATMFSVLIWSCSVFFLFVIMLIFVYRVAHSRPSQWQPEPFWLPPTVGIAVLGWTGVLLNAHTVIIEFFLWMPVLFCFVLVPVISFRILKDRTVANNSTIFIETAPFPLVMVSWIMVEGSEWISHFANFFLISIFFVFGNICFFITIYSAVIRWDTVYKEMGHKWASLTFPLVAYSRSALLFSQCVMKDNTRIHCEPVKPANLTVIDSLNKFVFVWSSVLCALLLPLVAHIIIAGSLHLLVVIKSNFNHVHEQSNKDRATETRTDDSKNIISHYLEI